MKHAGFCWGVLALVSLALAQTSWWRTFGGSVNDDGYAVIQAADGGFIVTGQTGSFGVAKGDVWLIKTDPAGGQMWSRTFGDFTANYGLSVEPTLDSGCIIAGLTTGMNGSDDFYLIRTNAQGDSVWARTYGGPAEDWALCVAPVSDGGFIATGWTYSFGPGIPGSPNLLLVRTDGAGETLWTRVLGGALGEEAYGVQQTRDGGFVVAGGTQSFGAGASDVWLIKIDTRGDTEWTMTYGTALDERGYSVEQTSDRGYIIAGDRTGPGPGLSDALLIRTDEQGETLWTRTFDQGFEDHAWSVRQTQDQGFIFTGWTQSGADQPWDVYLVKTDSLGNREWNRKFGGPDYDCGYSVRPTADSGYIVAGYTRSSGAGGDDVYLIKTDSEGNVGIAEPAMPRVRAQAIFGVQPNPFSSFARVVGREGESFSVSDISGRRVGVQRGSRIGEGLEPGVYFVSLITESGQIQKARIVKAATGE